MIQHNRWFYTEYKGVKYKAKIIDYGFTYSSIRIYKLWKFGIYFPFIWDVIDGNILNLILHRSAYYEEKI